MSFAKSRRRRFFLILPLIALFSISFVIASAAQAGGPAKVSVNISQPDNRTNDNQVLVTLFAEQATELYGAEFIMGFNPDELQVVEVSGGSCAKNTMTNLVENTTGVIRYASMELARRTSRGPQRCTIAQIMFEVNANTNSSVVTVNDMILVGPNAQIEAEAPSTLEVSNNIAPTAVSLSALEADSTALNSWLALFGFMIVAGSAIAWRMNSIVT